MLVLTMMEHEEIQVDCPDGTRFYIQCSRLETCRPRIVFDAPSGVKFRRKPRTEQRTTAGAPREEYRQ